MTVLTNARVLTPAGFVDGGWVHVVGARIAEVGTGTPPAGLVVDLGGRTLAPGFVDLHVHGGGGASMTSGDPEQVLEALAFHRRHGTTRSLASLISRPLREMATAAGAIADVVGRLGCEGVHLEGPFLSVARCGAHDPAHLQRPDVEELRALLDAGRGTVRSVTLATELPGGEDLIGLVRSEGAVAALGHSDATYAEGMHAARAGVGLGTHLWNGMSPLSHREPGAAGALLDADGVTVELICDGAHLHPAAVRLAFAAKGVEQVALVTDATAAAGLPDGPYAQGSTQVVVDGGQVRLADTGALAGSTLTMDAAVRWAVQQAGIPLADALAAASSTPARVLGIGDRVGAITAGREADLVALDDDLRVALVIAEGRVEHDPAGLTA